MNVKSRTRLAGSNLGRKGNVIAVLISKVANHPFRNHELVCRIVGINGEELNFVLLINHAVNREVAHFRVTVLNLSARLSDVSHTLGAEFVKLRIGCRLMVALLVSCGEHFIIRRNDIVFQFAHSLKLHARYVIECPACLTERVLGRTFEGFTVFVEERTEHGERGKFSKGIYKGCAETGKHIEVAASCFDEGEEATAVHAFATGEDGVKIFGIVNYKVERLEATIGSGIHEVDHANAVFFDEAHDVGLRKFLTGLAQISNYGVRIHFKS